MKNPTKQLYYVLALIAFVLVNYVMRDASVKLDFSKGRAYTLSDSTKSVLKNLKEPVTLTFFSSSVLPSRLQPIKRDVSDLLAEYKKEGRSNIILRLSNPRNNDKIKKEAESFQIPELNFSQQERDQFAITTGYFGIGITQKDKKAALPQVANTGDLEYNLTSAIYKITTKELPHIGLIGGDSPTQQFNTLRAVSASQFNLQDTATPEADMKAVLVIDNRQKSFSSEEAAKLEKYIADGGKAIFMIDGVWVTNDLLTGLADHNLYDLLKKFGIVLNQNLIMSTAAEIVNFGGQEGFQLMTGYPYWLRTQTFDKSNSYFSNVRQLSFPWTSSLKLAAPTAIRVSTLVRSVNSSWEQKKDFTLSPQSIKQPNQKDFRQMTLIASAKLKNGGEAMVIPSSRFVEDQLLSRTSDNLEFTLNVMSDYAAAGALSGIRQRSVDLYPIPPDLSNQQKDLFKYLTILLLPMLFAGYGLFRLIRRK